MPPTARGAEETPARGLQDEGPAPGQHGPGHDRTSPPTWPLNPYGRNKPSGMVLVGSHEPAAFSLVWVCLPFGQHFSERLFDILNPWLGACWSRASRSLVSWPTIASW